LKKKKLLPFPLLFWINCVRFRKGSLCTRGFSIPNYRVKMSSSDTLVQFMKPERTPLFPFLLMFQENLLLISDKFWSLIRGRGEFTIHTCVPSALNTELHPQLLKVTEPHKPNKENSDHQQ
jgi:hypothetical protein